MNEHLVPILRLADMPLVNVAADYIEDLESALRGLLDALPPDAHPDQALADAIDKARRLLAKPNHKP